MAVEKAEFRKVLGAFATGVTIITTRDAQGKHVGMTANAFTSLSLEPPLVLICVDKKADCYACFECTNAFAVNILSTEQEALSKRFATKGVDKFEGVSFHEGVTGSALIDSAIAHLDCRLVSGHEGGDHTIYVGQVESAAAVDADPLLFFRGGYRKLG